jgi:hypothetical protein
VLALLTGTDATVTGQQAAAADDPDPGSSWDGQQAAAEQVRDDLLPGEPPARVSAVAGRQGRQPAECAPGRGEAGT